LAYGRHEFTIHDPKFNGRTFTTTERRWELDRVRFLFLFAMNSVLIGTNRQPFQFEQDLVVVDTKTLEGFLIPQKPRFRQSFIARCNGTKEMSYLETCIFSGKFAWNKRPIEDATDSARAKRKPYKTDT